MTGPEFRVGTEWTPQDALDLLDAHDGWVAPTITRLGTLRVMAGRHLAAAVRECRESGMWPDRVIEEAHRRARVALRAETDRRVELVRDVARAHGLIGDTR